MIKNSVAKSKKRKARVKMTPQKILISDQVADKCSANLRARGFEVDYLPGLEPSRLLEIVEGFHGLIVRSATKVTAEAIARGKNLKVIGRAGVGTDNIDKAAATRHGVAVVNAPGANTISAAEHAIALMLALAREIPRAHISTSEGKWARASFRGAELYKKNLGLIGLGKIGLAVAARAKAFDMQVLSCDPLIPQEVFDSAGVLQNDLESLLRQSDFISIHVPLTPETTHLISEQQFELCKETLRIVNTSRGGVIDESALFDALQSGRIAGAALDVFEREPPGEHQLLRLSNVITTPHLGASTQEAQERVGEEIATVVADFLLAGKIDNVLNPEVVQDNQTT